mgnify:CR=1 FL=1
MKRLLLIVALLLVVAVSTAQVTTSAIRGQVTTNDNPLPGATIVALLASCSYTLALLFRQMLVMLLR